MKLTSLFKDSLESDDAEVRQRAVDELGSDDPRLAKIASGDDSPRVRVAAVVRLTDLDTLHRAVTGDADAAVKAAAGSRLMAVVGGNVDAAADSAARLAWLQQHGDEQLATGVATEGADPALRVAALERLEALNGDTLEKVCITVALEDSAAQVRLWAMQRVRSAAALEQIMSAAKSHDRRHDKRVLQLARERMAALRDAQAKNAERARLCEQLETLAIYPDGDGSSVVEISLAARVQAVENEWRQLGGDSEESDALQTRFLGALNTVRAMVAERQHLEDEQDALNDALTALLKQPEDGQLNAELERLAANWRALESVPEAATRAFDKRISDARRQHEMAVLDKDRFGAAERVLGSREKQLQAGDPVSPGALKSLEKAWARITLPQGDSAEPLKSRYQAVHNATRDAIKRQKSDSASAASDLKGLLDELEKRIEAGTLHEAESLFDKSRSRLQKATLDEARKAAVEKRLQAAAVRIGELKRWRHWSTDKARESLCEAAEALVGKQGKIAVLAQDVRALREQWKKLDHADGPARQAMWQRFNETCEKAYAPCKAHFDEQSARRAENLKKREALCDELKALEADTDWSAPDWRGIVTRQREISRAFFATVPVDRKAKKPSEKAFRKAGEALEAQLAGEREKELLRRRGLIRKVEALSAEQDIRKAVAAAQDAQKQWSPTVQCERKTENALWKDFRAACDVVFERRRETTQENRKQASAAEESRRTVCDTVLALEQELKGLEASAADFEALLNQLAGRFKTATDDWTPVGRGQRSKAEPRYRDACRKFEEAMKHRRREARQRDREVLAIRAAQCTALEQAAIGQAEVPAVEALGEREEQWHALAPSRGDVAKALARRFETALAACRGNADAAQKLSASLADNLERKQRLCLDLEIAADIESPEHLAQARMQHRIAQLSAAMGGSDGGGRSVPALAEEWYATGPVDSAEHAALEDRFRRALEAAGEPVA